MIGYGMTTVPRGYLTGHGIIAGRAPGLVSVSGAPAARRVMLFEQFSMRFVARTHSDNEGRYFFGRLNEHLRYMVIATDHLLAHNAVIRDNVAPYVDDD